MPPSKAKPVKQQVQKAKEASKRSTPAKAARSARPAMPKRKVASRTAKGGSASTARPKAAPRKAASPAAKSKPAAPKSKAAAPKPKATAPKPVVLRRRNPAPTVVSAASSTAAPLSIREQKVAIRREMKAALQKLRERTRRSREICEALVSHPSWRRSVIIAIFAPMDLEPDIELLWKHAEGKTVCYPTIRTGKLDFISVSGPEACTVQQHGFREPVFDPTRVIPPHTFDLVLVPGAAFTANGDRLGRGGGFYDRLLSSPGFRAFKVGVCFSKQVLDTLPLEPHDERVHRVVTESGWLQRPDFVRAGKPNA